MLEFPGRYGRVVDVRIAFIGLGAMGRRMAARLQCAGHEPTLHDLRREAADALVAAGTHWADDAAHAAKGTEILFTSLPGPAEVEAVALGASGVRDALPAGSAWFDLTTNSPDCVRRLHVAMLERGVLD